MTDKINPTEILLERREELIVFRDDMVERVKKSEKAKLEYMDAVTLHNKQIDNITEALNKLGYIDPDKVPRV